MWDSRDFSLARSLGRLRCFRTVGDLAAGTSIAMASTRKNSQIRLSDLAILIALAGTLLGGLLTLG